MKINFFNRNRKGYIFFLLFTVLMPSLAAQDYTKGERMYGLSMLWKDVSTKFHSPEHLQQINWDSLYVANMEKAIEAESDEDYYLLLERLMATLNDGHTEINYRHWKTGINEATGKKWNLSFEYLPMEIGAIGGDYYIWGVRKDKVSDIPLGSKVLEINGLPANEYLRKYMYPFVGAQTEQDRNRKALACLRDGKENDSIAFTIQTPEQHILKTGMRYNWEIDKIERETDMAGTRFSGTRQWRVTNTFLADDLSGRKYYHLRLDHFSRGNITGLIKRVSDKISQADYIVLDLRCNTGGSESEADTLLACFLNVDTLITYPSLTRKDNAFYAAMGYGYPEYKDFYNNSAMDTLPPDTMIKKDLPLFTQPLFVLISAKTYSAAEDFLIALKLHHPDRAILVGTPTGGSTGAPFVRLLPHHDAYYRICTRRPLLPEGMFENGIQPDYFYEPNIEEHLGDKDLIFDYAAKLYSEMKK